MKKGNGKRNFDKFKKRESAKRKSSRDALKRIVESLGYDPNGVKIADREERSYHRAKKGASESTKIAEGEFERAMIFCGTGMGIHIAASKCPRVHAAVVESPHAALRAITGNNVNVLAMGGHWIGKNLGIEIAEAYLYHNLKYGSCKL